MAITYTWTVTNMSVLQTPEPDFVVRANWLCSGVDGEYSASIDASSSFTDVEGGTFTAYSDLTEAEVLAWIWAKDGKESAEANVEGQIESQKNPPVSPTAEPLPW